MGEEIDAPTTVTPEPSAVVETEGPDPATARVAGVQPGETHTAVYDWLRRQLTPAAEAMDLATDGGSPRHNGLLPAELLSEFAPSVTTCQRRSERESRRVRGWTVVRRGDSSRTVRPVSTRLLRDDGFSIVARPEPT